MAFRGAGEAVDPRMIDAGTFDVPSTSIEGALGAFGQVRARFGSLGRRTAMTSAEALSMTSSPSFWGTDETFGSRMIDAGTFDVPSTSIESTLGTFGQLRARLCGLGRRTAMTSAEALAMMTSVASSPALRSADETLGSRMIDAGTLDVPSTSIEGALGTFAQLRARLGGLRWRTASSSSLTFSTPLGGADETVDIRTLETGALDVPSTSIEGALGARSRVSAGLERSRRWAAPPALVPLVVDLVCQRFGRARDVCLFGCTRYDENGERSNTTE